MRLVTKYFESISGIEIYPIISFLVFFTFFILVTFYVFRLDKKHVKEMSEFALDDTEPSPATDKQIDSI